MVAHVFVCLSLATQAFYITVFRKIKKAYVYILKRSVIDF